MGTLVIPRHLTRDRNFVCIMLIQVIPLRYTCDLWNSL